MQVGKAFFGFHRHLEDRIRLHAPIIGIFAVEEPVNVLAAGPPIAGGGQLEGALAAFHFDDVLHAALAVAALADNDGPLMILQCGRHDFAGAGAVFVNQNGHGVILGRDQKGALAVGVISFFLFFPPSGGHNPALGEKQPAHFHGRSQQAAGVGAQIQYQTPQTLLFQLDQSLAQLLGRGLVKPR